jgi:hypothetical protein
MEGIISQQEIKTKEAQKATTSFITKDRHNNDEKTTMEITSQTKRQRTEDTSRAGHAMQAGPRQ